MSNALKNAIEAEKKKIIKNIDSSGIIHGLAKEESAAPEALGEAVHEVKEYKGDGELFFIKDVTYGFKGIIYRILTGIGNEGMREAIGSAFYDAMGLSHSAKVGVIKNTSNKAVKIFSKKVGQPGDKICSLGQLLKGWDFDKDKIDEAKKIENVKKWLNRSENSDLKEEIMKAHAVSMLIGNRDLKDDNIMIIKKQSDGKLHCAPIDFGLSCHKVSTLRWAKNKHMHFDTDNMRHEDSLKLFNQEDYKKTLRTIVQEFRQKETEVLGYIYNTTEALREVGFTRHQYAALIQNIQSNVREAQKICGIGAAAGPNV